MHGKVSRAAAAAALTSADADAVDADAAAAGPAPTSGAPPAATIDHVTRPTNDQGDSLGTCPTGWIAMPAGACQRPCRGDADCHGRNRCQRRASGRPTTV